MRRLGLMRLLFGVFGENARGYLDSISHNINKYKVINMNCIISNINSGRIKYPFSVSDNGKVIFLNGLFILKDYSLDDFMNNSSTVLRSILKRSINDIPKEFVNGAYNGVILEEDSIYLFNDFMALSPMYYSIKNDILIFSTSLQLLSKMLKPNWDEEAITEFLKFGYNFTYKTILKGVFCLPPASILRYKNRTITIRNYTSFPGNVILNASLEKVVEEIHFRFKESIKRLYSPKLKYCLSLTGGMDSRLIFLEWPNKSELLTETAGENTSDYIKAKELVEKVGNPTLHELEDLKGELYFKGFKKYYDLCDNPTKLMADFNYYHLLWKQNRGADIHLSGVGGELFNGENLYLSRNPFYVLKEGVLPYVYNKLDFAAKISMIKKALYSDYKIKLLSLINQSYTLNHLDFEEVVVKILDEFHGNSFFKEAYIERFRTFMLANSGFYPLSFVTETNDFLILPYNDREFIQEVCKYHPSTRELRRLGILILRKYNDALDIPIDTTHLKLSYPYYAHKLMRVLRMVLNIGFHKKIPFIQKGEPPKYISSRYIDHSIKDYRDYIKSSILSCSFYDRDKVQKYLQEIDKVSRFSFYTNHNEAANISILFRLAMAEKKFEY